ncbi:UDP-glucuronosyltransferase 2B19-like [Pygocentrus nattereri]|uniref:UDP-glucuronosyltransferase 2B19-like n=1 Tax=Pygocentrus nattereri TaxID=42514 RepID=UPI001891E3B5|nr:UDP-glucuronosyltransferase 2B19-like [Pygocentrus nattereri]
MQNFLSGNILPGECSHWNNMCAIVDELTARNHSVTVLIHTTSPSVNYTQKENFKYLIASLRESHFDLLLFDPVTTCSDLLAETLDCPRVMSFLRDCSLVEDERPGDLSHHIWRT